MRESDRPKGTAHQDDTTQGNRPPPEDRSPPELDEAILKASRRAVRFHWVTSLLERVHLSPVAGWQLAVGITVGALICTGLDMLFGDRPEPAPAGMIHAGDPAESPAKAVDAETQSPESWLSHIAELVQNGRVSEALSELQAFRRSHPDYQGTAQKEPHPRIP